MVKISEKFIIDNSPTILAGIAVTGAVGTAYLTGKATFKASDIIRAEEERRRTQAHLQELPVERKDDALPMTTKEKMKLVWKEYLPAGTVLTGTIAAIVLSNTISASRLAALAAAYKVSEKHFAEYKDKVLEKFGEKKEQEVRSDINKERLIANPMRVSEVHPGSGGDVLFHDAWTSRYFRSDVQSLRAAENRINRRILLDMDASLADFYMEIGLSAPKMASEIGWTVDTPLEIRLDAEVADGGQEACMIVDFKNDPIPIRHHRYSGGN